MNRKIEDQILNNEPVDSYIYYAFTETDYLLFSKFQQDLLLYSRQVQIILEYYRKGPEE